MAIIVTDHPRDLAHDHLIVAGGGGPEIHAKIESPFARVNGRPRIEMGPGETADFESRPTAPGEWRLEVKSVEP